MQVDKYYNYEVTAYSPTSGRVERSVATDPYSRSLNCNGAYQIKGLACAQCYRPCLCCCHHVAQLSLFLVKRLLTDSLLSACVSAGTRTHIRDIRTPDLHPRDWATLASRKPALEHFLDMSIYELHVRDFSATDGSVPEELRGTFLAFVQDSHGARHLRSLAAAGLTHVHLLPSYDFGSVNEDRGQWRWPRGGLNRLPPASEDQQWAVCEVQDQDAYNWG